MEVRDMGHVWGSLEIAEKHACLPPLCALQGHWKLSHMVEKMALVIKKGVGIMHSSAFSTYSQGSSLCLGLLALAVFESFVTIF